MGMVIGPTEEGDYDMFSFFFFQHRYAVYIARIRAISFHLDFMAALYIPIDVGTRGIINESSLCIEIQHTKLSEPEKVDKYQPTHVEMGLDPFSHDDYNLSNFVLVIFSNMQIGIL